MQALDVTKSRVKARYGYDVGDSGAMLIAIFAEECEQNRQILAAAASRVSQSQKPFQSDNPWTAFCHGLGRNGVWVLPVLLVLGGGWLAYTDRETYRQTSAVLAAYPEASKFQLLIQEGKVVHGPSKEIHLVLRAAKDPNNPTVGREYVYRPDCRCIHVPMGYLR